MEKAKASWQECASCLGRRVVVDLGDGTERPCALCREAKYAEWVAERQPATRRHARLDDAGRCCGRKPLVYKRPIHHLFCTRCCADFNPKTGEQIENWAWVADGVSFVATSPTGDYVQAAFNRDGGDA